MKRTLVFPLLQREVDKPPLVAYVYCEPSLAFCCRIEKLIFIRCLNSNRRVNAIEPKSLALTENFYSMVIEHFGLPNQVWIQLLTAYTEIIEFSNNIPSGRNTTGRFSYKFRDGSS